MSIKAVIAIPARLASQRLPRKMLLAKTGRSLVEHTWRNASRATRAVGVVVVTDDKEIQSAVDGFGGQVVMTSPEASSGTARIVEALPCLPPAEIIVNLQGDEPELSPTAIDAAIACLEQCPEAGVATLVSPIGSIADLQNPSVVKAVLTPTSGINEPNIWRAITFSRAAVPAARDWTDELLAASPPLYWQHIGVYAYRRSILEQWDALPPSRLASLESLEQLRLVEAGVPIVAAAVDHTARGIDTNEDYEAFVARQLG